MTAANTKIPRAMQRVRTVPGGILSLAVLPATASAMQANPVSLRLLVARAQPVKKAHTGETVNSSARSILVLNYQSTSSNPILTSRPLTLVA